MKDHPKLLMITTVPITVNAFLIPYACYFRGLGWQVDAMANGITKFDDLSIHFDRTLDAALSRNPLSVTHILKTAGAIRQIVRSECYDIVHVHTPVAAFVARFALRGRKRAPGTSVVYTAHGFHFFHGGGKIRNFMFRSLEKIAGPWTDRLIVINREDYETAKKYGIVPPDNLTYMPGIGLDFARYDASAVPRAEIRQIHDQLGIKGDDALFSMIAEFSPCKRHQDVLEALSASENHKIHVAFAGNGALFEKTKRLANALKLQNRVHFLDNVKDIRPLVCASRAVILPSSREGLPRSLMEAACLGVPIVGSDVRGVRDVVCPNRGLLYPVGDIFALRDAMQRIFDEPHPKTTPDPDWRIENLIRLHRELYEELLETTNSCKNTPDL
jgi:glycosyltransferase involved in cell wall biosynthesis